VISNHYTLSLSAPTGGPVHNPQPGDMVGNFYNGHMRFGMVLEIFDKNRVRILWPDLSESSQVTHLKTEVII
jgi:hypothetical protein